MKFEPEQVASALQQSWSRATAGQWTEEHPAAGQCNVTALLVHELFGGELLKTQLSAGDHFYNRMTASGSISRKANSPIPSPTLTCRQHATMRSAAQQAPNW